MSTGARLLGHESALDGLRRLAAEDALAASLLITGPDGVGKTTFAQLLARDLTCLEPSGGSACGECRSCVLAAAGSHPDIHRITPPKEETTIGQVRELRYTAGLVPSLSPRRVIILERAETLNEQAANAILKILEDTPPRLSLMLLAPSPRGVLPTIRSRSLQIPLRSSPPAAVAGLLRESGVADSESEALAAYSGGAPGRAVALSRKPELLAVLGEIGQWMDRLAAAQPGAALKLAEDLKSLADAARKHLPGEDGASDRQAIAWVLDAVMGAVQAALHDQTGTPASISARWDRETLAQMVRATNETRRLILSYAQADLQVERLMMKFLLG